MGGTDAANDSTRNGAAVASPVRSGCMRGISCTLCDRPKANLLVSADDGAFLPVVLLLRQALPRKSMSTMGMKSGKADGRRASERTCKSSFVPTGGTSRTGSNISAAGGAVFDSEPLPLLELGRGGASELMLGGGFK